MPLIGACITDTKHKELFLEGLGGGYSVQCPLGELGGGDSEQSSLAQTLGDLGEGIRRSLHMRAGVPFQIQTL